MGASIADSAMSALFGLMVTGMNNSEAANRIKLDRAENYKYGEMSAWNADRRTRNLYNDFYSPEALLRQYNEAGLSPSLMFGGTPGQGGTAGAQGTGAAGPTTPFMPYSLVDAAQAAALFAQANKTKEETKNIAEDTKLKELQEQWQEMLNTEKGVPFKLSTLYFTHDDGTQTSLFEVAQDCNSYDEFIDTARKMAEKGDLKETVMLMGTELGQKTMREIFLNANRFDRDIKVLSSEGVSAEFQEKIMKCLKKEGFAEQNAQTAIKQLNAAAESADLTKEQKEAWNNIIKRLQRTNGTMADIIIVASMILNQAASQWTSTTIKLGGK